jgi:hypothetical protein
VPAHPNSIKNLRPGRPKGVLNKRTRLIMAATGPTANGMALTPLQVMANAMAFYMAKADEILKTITDARDQGIPISEFGKEMAKVMEYKDAASECAAKLAPYLHPRLAAVEVKTEQTQPFVIRVPAVETDADRWARAADNAKLINPKSNGSGE